MKQFNKNKRRTDYHVTKISSPEYFIVNILAKNLNDKIREYFKSQKSDYKPNILDLGCGSQPFRKLLESLNLNYFSSDVVVSEDIDVSFKVDFSEMIEEADFNYMKFDFILCTEVVEHIPDWDIFFRNINLISNDKAILILTSPFIYFIHETPFDFFRATPFAYEYYARRYSFEIIECIKAGDYFDVSGSIDAGSSGYTTNRSSQIIKTAAFILMILSKIKYRIKYSKIFRSYFTKNSLYYLSNIVILKKPEN